jgi:hypothetical protein
VDAIKNLARLDDAPGRPAPDFLERAASRAVDAGKADDCNRGSRFRRRKGLPFLLRFTRCRERSETGRHSLVSSTQAPLWSP